METETVELYARLLAVQAGLLAVIRSIPKSPDLSFAVRQESERVLAILLARAVPDSAMDAFQNQLETIQTAVRKYH